MEAEICRFGSHLTLWLPISIHLYGELSIGAGDAQAIDGKANVRSDDGDPARKACDCAEEVAKENHDAVALDQEADKRPADEDEDEAREKGCRALELLPAREEGERLLGANDDGEADEEKNLQPGCQYTFALGFRHSCSKGGSARGRCRTFPMASLRLSLAWYSSAHGILDILHGAVKEEHHTSNQKQAT